MTPRGSRLRLAVRLFFFVLINLALVPLYAMSLGPLSRFRRTLQVTWSRLLLRCVGVRVKVTGAPSATEPTIFVGNHVSYLDIPLISAFVRGTFVAKSDVARWPYFGLIAKMTGTIFVERVGSAAKVQQATLDRTLAAGESLIIFPEGTTSDGSGVVPFKSSLFSIATPSPKRPGGVAVQPFSLAYVSSPAGVPLTGPLASMYCWFGSDPLVPHMMRMMAFPGAVAHLRFHPVIEGGAVENRKLLARSAEESVAEGVRAAHGDAAGEVPATALGVSSAQLAASDAGYQSASSGR